MEVTIIHYSDRNCHSIVVSDSRTKEVIINKFWVIYNSMLFADIQLKKYFAIMNHGKIKWKIDIGHCAFMN